jgi:hypothetical protein
MTRLKQPLILDLEVVTFLHVKFSIFVEETHTGTPVIPEFLIKYVELLLFV